jgi:DNA-binding transcriptional ArsR family regulator
MTSDAATLDRTLAALADPTRRAVVDLLRKKPRRAGELADALETSAPAMSRHLRVLRTCGLVELDALDDDARVRLVRLRREPFMALRDWIDRVEAFWGDQLEAFRAHAERTRHPALKGRKP